MHRIKQILNRRGSAFIENGLWIILFSLAVAAVVYTLGGETSNAFERIVERVQDIGG